MKLTQRKKRTLSVSPIGKKIILMWYKYFVHTGQTDMSTAINYGHN
jgi:hypothetical protein